MFPFTSPLVFDVGSPEAPLLQVSEVQQNCPGIAVLKCPRVGATLSWSLDRSKAVKILTCAIGCCLYEALQYVRVALTIVLYCVKHDPSSCLRPFSYQICVHM